MALVRWDPFRDLAAFDERWNRFFDDFWRRSDDNVLTRGAWIPAVDIYENDKHELVLEAELPGMDRKDIEVTVENGTLTLRGERKLSQEFRKEQVHRLERSYGAFTRSFSLPRTVDAANVSAEYRNGTLRVTLPMREEARPKQIPVTVAA